MRRVVFLGLVVLWPGLAAADEVFVRGGGQLTGEVVEQGPDSIVVDVGIGRIGLPLSSVERIVPGPTPLSRYRDRAEGLEPDDVAGWLALARWAREQELEAQARQAFENVLAADPGNVTARRALGHVQVEGEWMTREESYRARGFVRVHGSWVTAEEGRALLEESRLAAEERRADAEAAVRLREAEASARIAEAEATRAETEARQIQFAASGVDSWAPSFPGIYSSPFTYSTFAYAYPPTFAYPGIRNRFHSGLTSRHGYMPRYRGGFSSGYGLTPSYTLTGAPMPRAPSFRVAAPVRAVPPSHRPAAGKVSGRPAGRRSR